MKPKNKKKIKKAIGIMMLLAIPIGILIGLILVFLEDWIVGLTLIGLAVIMSLILASWVWSALKLLE